jgi:hypothetical protein
MHPAATSWRGPSPWSGDGAVPPPRLLPRTPSERLLAASAVQLIAVLVWSAWLLLLASFFYSGGAHELACFDRDTAACREPFVFPLEPFLIQSAAWAPVIVAAMLAVVVAWRHRREESLSRPALAALALPAVAALAANQLAYIPLPLSS